MFCIRLCPKSRKSAVLSAEGTVIMRVLPRIKEKSCQAGRCHPGTQMRNWHREAAAYPGSHMLSLRLTPD